VILYPDVNVLIALFDASHQHHAIAEDLFMNGMRDGWASSPLTENGFIRIVSNPSYINSMSVADATDLLATAIKNTTHRRLFEDISLLDSTRFRTSQLVSHKQVTDLFLIGLAVRHDVCLVTFDRNIALSASIGVQDRHIKVL
jgi:toxin-antitoxin system PIN domain toxin